MTKKKTHEPIDFEAAKKKKPEPIPYANIDICRKSIDWHANEIFKLFAQLEPHQTPRAFVGGTDEAECTVFMIFKGTRDDIFKMRKFLEKEDTKST